MDLETVGGPLKPETQMERRFANNGGVPSNEPVVLTEQLEQVVSDLGVQGFRTYILDLEDMSIQ